MNLYLISLMLRVHFKCNNVLELMMLLATEDYLLCFAYLGPYGSRVSHNKAHLAAKPAIIQIFNRLIWQPVIVLLRALTMHHSLKLQRCFYSLNAFGVERSI